MNENGSETLFTFETDHLLSKWGFADGALLDDFLRENGYGHLDETSDEWYEFARRRVV